MGSDVSVHIIFTKFVFNISANFVQEEVLKKWNLHIPKMMFARCRCEAYMQLNFFVKGTMD